jgi:hypothetical protein
MPSRTQPSSRFITGMGHLRESQDQFADVFAKFNLVHRLTRIEKGVPLVLPL